MKCQVVDCPNEVFDVSGVMGFALCKEHLHGTDQNIPEMVGDAALLMQPVYRLCAECGEPTSMLDDGTSATVYHEKHLPHEKKIRAKATVSEPEIKTTTAKLTNPLIREPDPPASGNFVSSWPVSKDD